LAPTETATRPVCSTRIPCEISPAIRIARAVVAAFSIGATAACGPAPHSSDDPTPQGNAIWHELAAFERKPDQANWLRLHASLLSGAATIPIESRVVETLVQRPVPRNVFDAAAVDLATRNWTATMRTVRNANVAAQRDASPRAAAAVANSSGLIWRIVALRTIDADDAVDLTHTDLRADPPPPGMPLNLSHVDFSHGTLITMHWRDSNLAHAGFSGTLIAGTLSCTNCSFDGVRYGGTVVLRSGTWRHVSP
jgi:hypothetical protein